MTAQKTPYEIAVASILRTEGPRVFARMDALSLERGWDRFCRTAEQEREWEAEFSRVCDEESERSETMKAAIPEELLTEQEVLLYRRKGPEHEEAARLKLRHEIEAHEKEERNRRLDYLAGKLAGDGNNPEELDAFQIFLRAGFLGIDLETRAAILNRLADRKGLAA